MNSSGNIQETSILAAMKPSKATVKLAVPATIALLTKAVYNTVDTVYVGMLDSDTALAAVGITLPLLLIFVSIESIFAAGAAVLAGRQLGAGEKEKAEVTVSTVVAASVAVGTALCVGRIIFMEPLLQASGVSENVMALAKDYAFWMFIAAIANLPMQNLNCAARVESSVRISSAVVITGVALNVILDPVFMFDWGLNMRVTDASLATTISQFVTFGMLAWFYWSGRSMIKIRAHAVKPDKKLFGEVIRIGVPTVVVQIRLAAATSLTNVAVAALPGSDYIIAAYGVVQRLILIGCCVAMGFMQGYQPVAAYAFGARMEERFHDSARFVKKATLALSVGVALIYIVCSKLLIMLSNSNPIIVVYGSRLLISQVLLYPTFGLCYMMTITFQTIGARRYVPFLSAIRQGIFYIPLVLVLSAVWGIYGIYAVQPVAYILTLLAYLISGNAMKRIASQNMKEGVSQAS